MKRSLALKLAASFALIIILMISVALIGMDRFNDAAAEYMHIIGVQDKLISSAMTLETSIYLQQVRVNRHLSTKDESFKQEFIRNEDVPDSDIARIDALIAKIPSDARQEYIDRSDLIKASIKEFNSYIYDVFRMHDEGMNEAELSLYIKGTGNPIIANLNNSIANLITHTEDRQKARLDNAEKARRTSSLVQEAVLSISVIFSALIAVLLTRSITRPVRRMTDAAKAYASGDLTKELILSRTDDEIGVLTESFHTMSSNLRNIIGDVSRTAEYLASSSEELTASAEQASTATGQVAQTIEQIAIGTQQEVDAVHKTDAAVREMLELIESADIAVNEVAAETEGSLGKAASGEAAVADVISGMDGLRTTIENAVNMITGLAERSTEIGKVIELISEIAEQTNLLALNAAIESARAGEYGRGFAVVADEVRRLSERSQDSTKEIKLLVESINKEITGIVEAVKDGSSGVSRMVAIADDAGTALQEIASSIRTIKDSLDKIQLATGKVRISSDSVQSAMESISAITEETSASAEEVSASAEEQNAVLEEVAANAKSLSDTAQTLASSIAQFKL